MYNTRVTLNVSKLFSNQTSPITNCENLTFYYLGNYEDVFL